jgi:hypothetical protein
MFLSGMTECNQEEIEIKGKNIEILFIMLDGFQSLNMVIYAY